MKERELPDGMRNICGRRIYELRMGHKMKQGELLALLQVNGFDITASALSKIEGGHRLVRDRELIIFAKVLNTSVAYLIGEENE